VTLGVFLPGITKETTPVTLTDHDLSELAALEAGEVTDQIRQSLEWILQALIEAAVARMVSPGSPGHRRAAACAPGGRCLRT
jgi:hypothetical protein